MIGWNSTPILTMLSIRLIITDKDSNNAAWLLQINIPDIEVNSPWGSLKPDVSILLWKALAYTVDVPDFI